MPPSYRHSFLIVFAAALVAGSLGGTRAAWAEMVSITQPPAFEQDLAELLPGAQAKLKPLADKARNSGECPDQIKINVTVMRGGDPLFLETMAGARWDAIWNFFNDPNLGLRPGQLPPKSPPRGKFPPGLFDIDGAYDEVQVSRESGDNDDPTIEVKWSRGGNPIESGTKVKPGDKIKVEITALDRGKAETKACQTGIAKFEVRANGEVFDHRVFLKSECEKGYCSEGGRRRDWYTTIEVEKKHAPILWLEVTAEDHANNTSKVTIGQFPFTNWHGRIEVDTKSFPLHPTTGEATYRLRAYLALDYDDKGNMTGSVVGSATNEARAHDPPPGSLATTL